MTDNELWKDGVEAVIEEFSLLPFSVQKTVRELASTIRRCKLAIDVLTTEVAAATICATCSGACCRSGKYHFTAVDLLVFICNDERLFIPDFAAAACPYLGASGCLMRPAYRPFTCIIFFCEAIESVLSQEQVKVLNEKEQELRHTYRQVEQLFSRRFMHGLLINAERELFQNKGTILGRYG